MPYYKAISIFLKSRDDYITENNLKKGNRKMHEFLGDIYPERFDKIFQKFCEELKQ